MNNKINDTHTDHEQRKESVVLSKSPDKAIREMMRIIEILRDLYVRETDALEKADTKIFLALQDDKMRATIQYQNAIGQMLARKGDFKHVDPTLKKNLKKMQNEFSSLTQRNLSALERMQKSMKRLGDRIMEAAKRTAEQEHSYSYGASGRLEQSRKAAVSTGVIETA